MLVKELVEKLQTFDPDLEVVSADVWHDEPRYRTLKAPRVIALQKKPEELCLSSPTYRRKLEQGTAEPEFAEPEVKWFGYESEKVSPNNYLLLWVSP